VTLTKEIAHGIVIDRCPQCRGVWLDAGELERMNTDATIEAISAMSYALPRV
jgi:Zn-finger nucleic acid-binding protein